MGAAQGKPLARLSRDEVAQVVKEIGQGYHSYADLLLHNAVDGSLLVSLSHTELEETLDDLGIRNRLHRRVLVKTLNIAKETGEYASQCYEYDTETPTITLEDYGRVTALCLQSHKKTAVMAAVNLVLNNGNHLSLDTKILDNGKMSTERKHVAAGQSLCSKLVRDGSQRDYYQQQLPVDICEKLFSNSSDQHTYTGHVLRNESGKRIGMVCMIDRCSPSAMEENGRQFFLRQMANAVEYQLKVRKSLLARKNALLQQQEDCLPQPTTNCEIVVRQQAPLIAPVTALASPGSPNYEKEKTATLQHLGLTEMEPEDQIAVHLKDLIEMATQAFGFPYGEIIFRNNDSYFRIATVCGSHELNNALSHMNQVVKRNPDGTPFLCKMLRASVIYKNSLEAVKTCVVHDMGENNNAFPWLAAMSPIRSYIGTPIVDATGKHSAILCLCDTKPRPDVDMAQEFQIEQFAKLVMQILENWALTRVIEDLEHGRSNLRDKMGPPRSRDVTIVVVSIEGSTTLWQSLSINMREACLTIHDNILKGISEKHWGYKFESECSDECAFAFHDPVDAIAFAIEVQAALYEADWPAGLECLPETEEVKGSFRGLRDKMGIHHGRKELTDHVDNGPVNYIGQTVHLARSLCATSRGGQILTTFKTWDVASYFASGFSGYPQVLDLGMHVIQMVNASHGGVETARIVQLVPSNLAYDYFAARKWLPQDIDSSEACLAVTTERLLGRRFPSISSLKQVSASFHDAPFGNNKVTIAFVNMSAIDERRVPFLINLIGFLLDCEKEFGGYQCKKEMLVFQRPVDAVLFGLRLQEELRLREPQSDDGTSLANLIKYGCMHDFFVTMGPQRTTGRADYFGNVVNRAARLSAAAPTGSVCYGVASTNRPAGGRFDRIEHPSIKTTFVRRQKLKGIRDEFDVFECERVGYM